MSPPASPNTESMDPLKAGGILLSAYILWGLSPIYYKFAGFASPLEIVLHRAVWSAPILAGLLIYSRRFNAAIALVTDWRTMALLTITALIIASNWLIFIWAINVGRVIEVSLGYYINPLMHIAVGVFIASERFGRWRALAVGLAALGVLNQIVQLGEIPWIGLYLAISFTVYGYIRKRIAVDGQTGLFWETTLIFIPSVFLLGIFQFQGDATFLDGPFEMAMLIGSGAATVLPLLLWVVGARHLSFSVIGVVQFVAPTLQFSVGLAYGEVFTPAHAVTFALIWLGLAVFVADLFWHERQLKRQTVEQSSS